MVHTRTSLSFYNNIYVLTLLSSVYSTFMKKKKEMAQKICIEYPIGSSLHVTFINCLDVGIAWV